MGKHRRRHVLRQYDDVARSALRYESDQQYSWIVYAIAALAVGGLMGYVLAVQGTRSAASGTSAPTATTSPTAPVTDEGALRAYRDILARDPKNIQAAVGAANILYDARRYVEAIPLYQQAFALNPTDVNVSTDLGTALWYSGRPDEALAQYDKSLAVNPTHAQTLFNIGIVKSEGKRDYAGAVSAWEKLMNTNPTYPDMVKLRGLMVDAQQKIPVDRPVATRTGS